MNVLISTINTMVINEQKNIDADAFVVSRY
jgi:hypothetical protein